MVAILSGWLGLWLNWSQGVTDHTNSSGMGVWLVTPLLVSLLLRWKAGDGWYDTGLRPLFAINMFWYLFAFLFYPAVIFIITVSGVLTGNVDFSTMDNGMTGLLLLIGNYLILMFVKNIFEEFSWRGYLAPRLKASGISDFAAYIITGSVWTCWHIPYWAYFLPADVISKYAPYTLGEFILLGVIGMSAGSFLLGELRFITKSVWPAVIMHNVINAVSLSLLLGGYFKSDLMIIFTPGMEGMLATFAVIGGGIYLRNYRCRNEKTEC